METDLLLTNIRSIIAITDSDWQLVSSLAVHRSFQKKEFISREGEVNRFTNFIEEGSARVFYIDGKGQEHVIQLGIPGWWTSDFASFITQKKGLLNIETLEPTKIISFSYDHLQVIYDKIPAFERFYRLLIQNAYASFQYRMLQNLSMDAEQRYLLFREQYPQIDARISQKHIASYLGMSAEFLSKIKKRIHGRIKQNRITTSS